MVKKLAFLLTAETWWSSLVRALVFVLLLAAIFIGWRAGFSWLVVPFFVLFSTIVYFLLPQERKILRTSFWLLTILSIISMRLLEASPLQIFPLSVVVFVVILFLGVMFSMILGLVYFRFSERFLVYDILNTAILVLIFLVFLPFGAPHFLGWVAPALFLVSALCFKEVFSFRGVKSRKGWLAAFVLGLIVIEISWFTLSLTIGIINSAALLVLFSVSLRDLLTAHFRGRLTSTLIFRQFTFFVLLTVIIFAASTWTL